MKKEKKAVTKLPVWKNPVFRWVAGWAVLCALGVFLVYYWRVFYDFNRMSAATATVLTVLGFSALYTALALTLRFVKSLAGRTAVLLVAAGLVMCFASPPIQVPDEGQHFLRSYAISMGRFDFDARRGYPADVDLLMECFPGAYTNGNDGAPVKQYYHVEETQTPEGEPTEVRIPDGGVISIADRFALYRDGLAALKAGEAPTAQPWTEPLVVMLLPYFPQALGMAAARLFGCSALGCLYGGRIANLLVYALLAYFTMKNLRRWRGVFLAVLFLPLSLYLAASLNYDAQLLGLYALAASLLLREEFEQKHLWQYLAVVALMNVAKPWINLLWLPGLLFVNKKNRRTRIKPWVGMLIGMAASLAVTMFFVWYDRSFRYNYGEVGRMLGGTVVPMQQLLFVVKNPLRTLAVLWGTLFENDFFLPGLALFGALDTPVPAAAWLSAALLAAGVFSCCHHRPLPAWTNIGIACFCGLYTVGVMMAMYITYTPVGMVRVIGLQARYFLPAVLLGLVLLTQALGWLQRRSGVTLQAVNPEVKAAAKTAVHPMLVIGYAAAVLGGILLLQTCFVGPVTWALTEILP